MKYEYLPSAALAVMLGMPAAFAADGIVLAEPEAAEYMRVCDIYGAGFYYIPGTEHCLRMSGYAQYDVGVGDLFGRTSWDKKNGAPDQNDTYFKRSRVTLQLDSRTETELGTLRSYTELFLDDGSTRDAYSNTGFSWELKHAFIELGGLRVGKSDSLFKTFTLAGGKVINEQLVPFAPVPTNQISYTFKGSNGFSSLIALEQGHGTNTIDSYVPHIVAGAGFKQKWGSVIGVAGYDSNYEEWAAKLRLDLNVGEAISLWAMVGYGSDDHVAKSFYKPWGGNWAVWGGGSARVSRKATTNLALGYDEDKNFAAIANVVYSVVPGFFVQPEVAYKDRLKTSGDGELGGWLRIRRSF